MLRVTAKKEDSIEIWELEGKLSGDWVAELDRYWKERPSQPGITLQVHLKAVSYIDAAGKQLLADMHMSGLEIKGCGCMARAVVEEIVRDAGARRSQGSIKKILAVILFGFCFFGGSALLAAEGKSLSRHSVQGAAAEATGLAGKRGMRIRSRKSHSQTPRWACERLIYNMTETFHDGLGPFMQRRSESHS